MNKTKKHIDVLMKDLNKLSELYYINHLNKEHKESKKRIDKARLILSYIRALDLNN